MTDEAQWRNKLSPDEYRVCREKATEPPFSGEYNDNHRSGNYRCKCCGENLFDARDKFDSGSGWPSFDKPGCGEPVHCEEDNSLGMRRVEVSCEKCGSHLGHLFEDGPRETTGQRYCINSLSLDFEEAGE